jgi:uncharacterized protein (DUF1330 family)
MLAALLLAATAPATTAPCDGKPVIMVVRGLIADRARLMGYAKALQASGLYPQLGGYYLNVPRVLDVFEGTPPPNESILMVRFPCLAHARAFWHSRAYQQQVRPERLNPSAGDFTVTVYAEAALPPHMAGRVTPPAYTPAVPGGALPPQVAPPPAQ